MDKADSALGRVISPFSCVRKLPLSQGLPPTIAGVVTLHHQTCFWNSGSSAIFGDVRAFQPIEQHDAKWIMPNQDSQ